MSSSDSPLPPPLLPQLELDDVLSDAPFSERHSRIINRPVDEVWPACLEVTATEIRTLGPLGALRALPSWLTSGRTARTGNTADSLPLLDAIGPAGFVLLRRDDRPIDGRGIVLVGAAGQFWSILHNARIRFESPQAYLDFGDVGYAKTVISMEAVDLGQGRTKLETVTLVAGTDLASSNRFRLYWTIIRGPSGLIRRSWLAAVNRRVK